MVISIQSKVVDTPLIAAATVMVLRDTPTGLEVLLVRRHGNSGVLGGVHVFPGGKLDPADCQANSADLDLAPAACLQALGEPELDAGTAVGLHVAALRETFEESGLLLGSVGLPASADLLMRVRAHTLIGTAFTSALRIMDQVLTVSALVPWSRWVTPRVPSMMSKRFDTRFFVAVAPQGQTVEHCTIEATEAVWMAPRAGLERCWAGEIELAPPQVMSLAELARFGNAAQVLAAARSRPPALIEPEPFDVEGQRVICYPGDPAHSVRQRAWAGPTRLTFRNQRFEAEGGLEALLG